MKAVAGISREEPVVRDQEFASSLILGHSLVYRIGVNSSPCQYKNRHRSLLPISRLELNATINTIPATLSLHPSRLISLAGSVNLHYSNNYAEAPLDVLEA